MQAVSPLVNELQLGSRLNCAVESNRRGEFALLLSLLSADARDMAQFQTPEFKDEDLRAKFELGGSQALIKRLSKDSPVTNNSTAFQNGGVTAFRLNNAMDEEALVIRGNEQLDMEEVLANCDNHARNRYQNIAIEQSVKSTHFVDQLVMQRQMSELIAQA
ncbi:VC2046/SO_2500 family protein [Shewanella sp. 10N.286.54.B9]|uniref:VC2046/SO_2500 family protein n=1 Tax=Shewanella sp. 10N.286.54.B9 TaxID=3229719 RepID=UPI0035512A16